jgi:DNA-binding beta-propeller fold protein YncE
MYVIGSVGDDVNEYNLSTAWDISTISYNQTSSVQAQEASPSGLFFKDDGTKMYVIGLSGDNVYEYSLSTAWDISSKSYLRFFSVKTKSPAPQGLFFKSDGTKMYISDSSRDSLFSYDLSTAWDISTASFNYPSTDYYDLQTVGLCTDLFFKPDGTKVCFLNRSVDNVYEYNLSTAWDISTASYVQNFSVNLQEASPTGLFFKDDGTKMYIVGFSGDDVNEYNLTTAWDISTASFSQLFSISAQETAPSGISFKSDGTKMYIIGYSGDDVNEYNLTTAWDISTASFSQLFSEVGQDGTPFGLLFKPEGTTMYMLGFNSDAVYEYTLSTAWDVSTASYVQNFSVGLEIINPEGLFFKDDGTKMYVIGSTNKAAWSYDL